MKRYLFASAAMVLGLAISACSSDDSTTKGTTGGDGGATSSSSSSSSSGGSANNPGVFDCKTWKSICPNEPPRDEFEIELCEEEMAGPCGALLQTLKNCLVANEKCTADGKSDLNASTEACSEEYKPVGQCIKENEPDGG
jgi:hypothetical protein